MDVNVTGVWLCMKQEIARMLEGGGGAIVNLSSIYGLVAAAGTAAYTASKHAVAGLTKTAALDYAKKNIRVNALSPGYTRTALVEGVISHKPEIEDWFVERTPIGRMGDTPGDRGGRGVALLRRRLVPDRGGAAGGRGRRRPVGGRGPAATPGLRVR